MKLGRSIRAYMFDMDGTLVDSEPHTPVTVTRFLAQQNLSPGSMDLTQFHGYTWQHIADTLNTDFPQLHTPCTAAALHDIFHNLGLETPPPFGPGADTALTAACQAAPTQIVTSANRESVEHLLRRLDIRDKLAGILAADDFQSSKPDPECYLLAAERIDVAPEHCMVFEDSIAGIRAGKAAGMQVVAILHATPDAAQARAMADHAIADFSRLPANFFGAVPTRAQNPSLGG